MHWAVIQGCHLHTSIESSVMQMQRMANIRLYCEEFTVSQVSHKNESIVVFIEDSSIYALSNSLVYNMSENLNCVKCKDI